MMPSPLPPSPVQLYRDLIATGRLFSYTDHHRGHAHPEWTTPNPNANPALAWQCSMFPLGRWAHVRDLECAQQSANYSNTTWTTLYWRLATEMCAQDALMTPRHCIGSVSWHLLIHCYRASASIGTQRLLELSPFITFLCSRDISATKTQKKN